MPLLLIALQFNKKIVKKRAGLRFFLILLTYELRFLGLPATFVPNAFIPIANIIESSYIREEEEKNGAFQFPFNNL